MSFTDAEWKYLRSQFLGRLATIAPDGYPQNNPVGFFLHREANFVDIGGADLGNTRKFHNVQANPHVSLVVDDIKSTNPWRVRGVEIRGDAEALTDIDPPRPGYSRELIRIHITRIRSWNLEVV